MTDTYHHLQIETLLDGLEYPATKPEIILHAESRGASEDALDQLQAIPEDEYNDQPALLSVIGTIEAQPGDENLWGSAESTDIPDADEQPHRVTAKDMLA